MKIRIVDRIMMGITGLLLLAASVCALGLHFGLIPETLLKALDSKLILYMAAGVAALLGIYCLSVIFRRRKGKRGFVQQSNEHGELSISVKAIDALVRKCVDQHPEMKLNSNRVEINDDSVIVHLSVQMAGGISIPLAVGALQKQIHSYVTACTGVEVREACVQVETTGEQQTSSLYAVPELLAAPAPVKEVTNAVVSDPEETEQKDRATHQRIFGHDEQPAVVPAPPVSEATNDQTAVTETAESDDEAVETVEAVVDAAESADEEAADTADAVEAAADQDPKTVETGVTEENHNEEI